jgi:hypothetical protein
MDLRMINGGQDCWIFTREKARTAFPFVGIVHLLPGWSPEKMGHHGDLSQPAAKPSGKRMRTWSNA